MNALIKASENVQHRAWNIIRQTKVMDIWTAHGAEVNVVGSLAMGLMMKHLDIDLHVYSSPLTIKASFDAMSQIAECLGIIRIECRNLLDTEEECIEWHAWYVDGQGDTWQIDIIHIVKGSKYDGYFERMARQVKQALTDDTRLAILRLKNETPDNEHIMGVEYYQAVLKYGVRTMPEFIEWRKSHPTDGILEWTP